MSIVIALLVGSFLLLFYYSSRDRFFQAYGLFFLILVVYASNKALYGIREEWSEGAFAPLSLVRWGLLGLLIFYGFRVKMPPHFRPDVALGALVVLLLFDIVASSSYSPDFNYSLLRALSFTTLAVAMLTGMTFYLYWRENCSDYFHFHYYAAWIVLAPMMLLHLVGLGRFGVTLIMGQYAGLFGNQNMLGIFSALIMPYVLFHWQVKAKTTLARALDLALLGLIFIGVWLSSSRGGLSSCVLVVAIYFFVVNLESRIKIIAAAVCVIAGIIIFSSLKQDVTRFIKKDTANAEVYGSTSQLTEEKRFEMWNGVWPLFWKEKLTGYGFAASHLLVFPFTQDKEAGRSIHNSYLEIFGDLGLPGAVLLLLILYRVLTKAIVLTRRRGDHLERNINAVFIAIFVAGAINACFESWMFSVGNLISLMFWGPVAGVVARWAWRPVEAQQPAHSPMAQQELGYSGLRVQ